MELGRVIEAAKRPIEVMGNALAWAAGVRPPEAESNIDASNPEYIDAVRACVIPDKVEYPEQN